MEHTLNDKNKKYFIGIDIGGTKINIALIDEEGNILFKEKLITADNIQKEIVVKNITQVVKNINNKFIDKNILGIGIGSAGIILYKKGIIKFSPNIGWKDFEIVKNLQDSTGMKVVLDNDANAAAWGMFYLNYKDKYENMICITLGTGIGGGLILNGKMFRGVDGTAGEIGHITYNPDGPLCSCGNTGCIERYIGTKGIIEFVANYLKNIENDSTGMFSQYKNSLLFNAKKENEIITPKLLQEVAAQGDLLAIEIWNRFGKMLGVLIASMLNLFNPDAIHITGGISHAQKFFEKALFEEIKLRAFSVPFETAELIFEEQKQDMGVIGAGLLLLSE
jgi:glucokinase